MAIFALILKATVGGIVTHDPEVKTEPSGLWRTTLRVRALIQKAALIVSVLVGIALATETVKKFGLDLPDIAKGLYEEIGQFDPQQFERDFADATLNCIGRNIFREHPIGLFPPTFRPVVFRDCPSISIWETVSNVPFAWRYAVGQWYARSGIVENTITAVSLLLPLLVLRLLYREGVFFRVPSFWIFMMSLGLIAGLVIVGGQPFLALWVFLVRAPFYAVFALSYGLLSLAAWLAAPCATVYWLCRLDRPVDLWHQYKGLTEAVHAIKKLLRKV